MALLGLCFIEEAVIDLKGKINIRVELHKNLREKRINITNSISFLHNIFLSCGCILRKKIRHTTL
jgi:hypothetical protein